MRSRFAELRQHRRIWRQRSEAPTATDVRTDPGRCAVRSSRYSCPLHSVPCIFKPSFIFTSSVLLLLPVALRAVYIQAVLHFHLLYPLYVDPVPPAHFPTCRVPRFRSPRTSLIQELHSLPHW